MRFFNRFLADFRADLRVSLPLAWRLFLRSVQASYRQSWLKYVWLLLPPIATTAMWVYLHSAKILDVGATNLPYPLYVLSGTILWQVFAEALLSPLQKLSEARNILTKSRIPHEALLLAGLIEVLFNFAVRLAVLIPVFIWFQSHGSLSLSPASLLAPLPMLALMLLGFTLGLLLTPIGLLYQDVPRGLNLIIGFWFFLTPVIYPTPATGTALSLLAINPVTPLLNIARNWLTSGKTDITQDFVLVVALTIPALLFALFFQRLARPHVVARLG